MNEVITGGRVNAAVDSRQRALVGGVAVRGPLEQRECRPVEKEREKNAART